MIRNFLEQHISAKHLFFSSMLILPAYLLQDNLIIRIVQVLIFAFLAKNAGKRIKWMYFVLIFLSITVFNVLAPFGRVIFRIGFFPVTEGALRFGVFKGLTIVGLVFISLFSVRPSLRLPGRFGGLLGKLFYYFESLIDSKKRIRAKQFIASVDEVLYEHFSPNSAFSESQKITEEVAAAGKIATNRSKNSVRTTKYGFTFLLTLVILNWSTAIVLIIL